MAAVQCVAVSASPKVALRRECNGLAMKSLPVKAAAPKMVAVVKRSSALTTRCDYLGSPTNVIMIAAITAQLVAGRFGLAPSANRSTTAGLKLYDAPTGITTGDPAGFTLTDVAAHGAVGHVLGIGIVLGLKGIGAL